MSWRCAAPRRTVPCRAVPCRIRCERARHRPIILEIGLFKVVERRVDYKQTNVVLECSVSVVFSIRVKRRNTATHWTTWTYSSPASLPSNVALNLSPSRSRSVVTPTSSETTVLICVICHSGNKLLQNWSCLRADFAVSVLKIYIQGVP